MKFLTTSTILNYNVVKPLLTKNLATYISSFCLSIGDVRSLPKVYCGKLPTTSLFLSLSFAKFNSNYSVYRNLMAGA